MYFNRKQYFRDTTAPMTLSETIPSKFVEPVRVKPSLFPSPSLIDARDDYRGNQLLTYLDRNGMTKTISLMKGANKPRGIDGKVKWSMTPSKFKRTRGLRGGGDGAFIGGTKRRDLSTEFFKSRYQSAYGEMLIAKKVSDSNKVSGDKVKVLNEENKKLNDRLNVKTESNKIARDRLAQDKLGHDSLLLALARGGGGGGYAFTGTGGGGLAPSLSQPAVVGADERQDFLDREKDYKKQIGLGAEKLKKEKDIGRNVNESQKREIKLQKEIGRRELEKERKQNRDFLDGISPMDIVNLRDDIEKRKTKPVAPPPDIDLEKQKAERRKSLIEGDFEGFKPAPVPIIPSVIPPPVSEPVAEEIVQLPEISSGGEDVSEEEDPEEARRKVARRQLIGRGASAEPDDLQRVDSGATTSTTKSIAEEAVGRELDLAKKRLEELDKGTPRSSGSRTSRKVKKEAERLLKLSSEETGEKITGVIGGSKVESVSNPLADEPAPAPEPKKAEEPAPEPKKKKGGGFTPPIPIIPVIDPKGKFKERDIAARKKFLDKYSYISEGDSIREITSKLLENATNLPQWGSMVADFNNFADASGGRLRPLGQGRNMLAEKDLEKAINKKFFKKKNIAPKPDLTKKETEEVFKGDPAGEALGSLAVDMRQKKAKQNKFLQKYSYVKETDRVNDIVKKLIANTDTEDKFRKSLIDYEAYRKAGDEPQLSQTEMYVKRWNDSKAPKEAKEPAPEVSGGGSNERQLKQLSDRYPTIELERSPNTILKQLVESLSKSKQSIAEFDRGVRDIQSIFDFQTQLGIKNRQKLSQSTIDKWKGKLPQD